MKTVNKKYLPAIVMMITSLYASAQTMAANPFGMIYRDSFTANVPGNVTLHPVTYKLNAQADSNTTNMLSSKQQSIITIAALTATGDLQKLQKALSDGLDAGLTVNQIKETLVHTYAYCGFPRSIRGLQTFMEVLENRKAKGLQDVQGKEASPISQTESKYERGRKILDTLVHATEGRPVSGYGIFAPVIDTFLKEHLFADIFERDVLTYAEKELVTLSVISAIGKAEPMLQAHFNIALNVGLTPAQLKAFTDVIKPPLGSKPAKNAQLVLQKVLEQPVRK